MNELATVNAVGELVIERAAPEDAAAAMRPADTLLDVGAMAVRVELIRQQIDQPDIKGELLDVTDQGRFLLDDERLALHDIVTQRHEPTHPQPLLLGCNNLIPDPLASRLTPTLGK